MPCPSREELLQAYRDAPSSHYQYTFDINAAWRTARTSLAALAQGHARFAVLDLGCYDGQFLSGLPGDWHKFGVEPSEQARAEAEGRGVTLVGHEIAPPEPKWRARFDAVTLQDVLEHLPDPRAGLAWALAYVKPGGRLFVSTANLDAWTWRWLGMQHWYLQSIEHISFAAPRFFRWFCQSEGAALRSIRPIPHQYGGQQQRLSDGVIAAYVGLHRRGGGWRIPQRLIQAVPAWQYLMHKKLMPCTFSLTDHIFVEIERTDDGTP